MPELPIIDADYTILSEGRPLQNDLSSQMLAATESSPSGQSADLNPVRPQAAFVAQLIGAAIRVPQSRAFRRASPADALASYRAEGSQQRTPDLPGRRMSLIA